MSKHHYEGFNDEYDYDNPEFYEKQKRRPKRSKRKSRDEYEDEWEDY